MRGLLGWCCCGVLAALTACGQELADSGPSANRLVLEVGGEHGSMRAALSAAGVVLAPPHVLRTPPRTLPADLPEVDPAGSDAASEQPEPPLPGSSPEPAPEPIRAEPEFRQVPLRRGQTLIHLAKEHLGNGNRFRDLLQWNGWTEQQARRLPEGTLVRIRVEAKTAGAKNAGAKR